MVSYIYDKILNSPDVPEKKIEARNFFRGAAQEISVSDASPMKMLGGNKADQTNRILPGRLYMFMYDPKLKKELPYYDTFPLIMVVDVDRDSFLGLNFHYLPPQLRANLFDELYNRVVAQDAMNIQTKIRVSYQILKSASALKFFRPCLKRYLLGRVRSRYLYIPPEKWDIALMLPTARFKKASINKVYADSRRKARRR